MQLEATGRAPRRPYHGHNVSYDRENRPYSWIFFDYIDGPNLKDKLAEEGFRLELPFVESVITALLGVLYACAVEGIVHGDLHAGNVLIAKPDRRIPNSRPTVWISDFGYGGSHNFVKPKDDFHGAATIMLDLLARLVPSELNPRDKVLHSLLLTFVSKRVRDAGRTPKLDAGALLTEFEELTGRAERESAAGESDEAPENRKPADYLWAEALGTRREAWRNLFVPDLLISGIGGESGELLSKTITVLTGARGCGKTMSFRRLTKLLDVIVGEELAIPGATTFVGFYLNCRDLTDAFPWVPRQLGDIGEQQIIHFFHLAWLAEACKTLAAVDPQEAGDYRWLEKWLQGFFPTFPTSASGERIIAHARSFIETEKERTRLLDIGKSDGPWYLARIDLLDEFFRQIGHHVTWIGGLPVYLFLDDYTTPLVPRGIQLALNPIIFRRRSHIFFKISTEASNSFIATGARQKPLELHHDFMLLDLASESIHQKPVDREKLLDLVFRRRIKRHREFADQEYGLLDLLGRTPYSNNDLAWQLRNNEKERVLYHGIQVFAGLWTSDVRTMVEMFNDMLREANGKISKSQPQIPKELQDQCIRNQGGEMMAFTQSLRDYELWKQTSGKKERAENFGNHLKSVVEAFMRVARYELVEGKLVANQGRENPKQAFRIEIVDSFRPDRKIRGYLEGLIRYHIFLQDWRGKSQRGMLTPRIYLNRMFIPYGGLTLSSHDHIQLKNSEFMSLLEKPTEFFEYWKRKRLQQRAGNGRGGKDSQQEFRMKG